MLMSNAGRSLMRIDEITIPDNRQRTGTKENNELKNSIARVGLIHPIVISQDHELVAGECRLTAITELWKEGHEYWKEGYVPITFSNEITPEELKIIEFEENIKRSDLTWQDKAAAVLDYHSRMCELQEWDVECTAGALSLTARSIRRLLSVARAVAGDPEHFSTFATMGAALNYIDRQTTRALDSEFSQLGAARGLLPTGLEDLEITELAPDADMDLELPDLSSIDVNEPDEWVTKMQRGDGSLLGKTGEDLVHQQNFNDWVLRKHSVIYNFIHCDFPYGVNHEKSAQGGAKSKAHKSYEDSSEIFFELLHSMLRYRDNFMAQDCHIMFWLSLKHWDEVKSMFAAVDGAGTPARDREFKIWQDPLIWYKSDNTGIVRDAARGPRHIYESALLITRGDRPLVRTASDVVALPAAKKTATHISEKPWPMLGDFFKMFVDKTTYMLDPTCGSGNALTSALMQYAKFVTGLDIDAEHVKTARDAVTQRLRFMEKLGVGQ